MTINSLSTIASTPVCGLNTQTYNVTTAGLYTVSFNAFLPYLASGTPAQSVSPSVNVTDVTLAADTAGSRNNTYFTFYTAGNLYGYYVWFNINSAGTDPAVSGLTGIEVAGATGATANTLATAARAAINAAIGSGQSKPYVTISGSTSHVIITQINPGTLTAAANGAGGSSAGASFSVTAAGSYGTPEQSGLNCVIYKNSTAILREGWPSPTQPLMSGAVRTSVSAGDTITYVTSSLSNADAGLNAVKSIVNVYLGE